MSAFFKLPSVSKRLLPTLSADNIMSLTDLNEHDATCFYNFGGDESCLTNLINNGPVLSFLGAKPEVKKEGILSMANTLLDTGFIRKKTEAYSIAVVYFSATNYDHAMSPFFVGDTASFLRLLESNANVTVGFNGSDYLYTNGVKPIFVPSPPNGTIDPKLVVYTNDGNGTATAYVSFDFDNPITVLSIPTLVDWPTTLRIGSASTYGQKTIISEMTLFDKALAQHDVVSFYARAKKRCKIKAVNI